MITQPTRLAMFFKFMEFYGLREYPGPQENNPTILQWFRDIGHVWVQNDELAWCSCMMNWLAWYLRIHRSGKLDARSWLDVGANVPLHEAALGHLVILWREEPTSWKGHVGLFVGLEGDQIYVAGGNQSNQVNISPYPKGRLLAVKELSYV